MKYTVKQLSKISGVTVRTLHYYDEIGLLKPAYVGQHGYRYYEEGELLKLQQILFYREMSMPLSEIQKIIQASGSNKIAALQKHQNFLKTKIHQYQTLMKTIDKTVLHLKGEMQMKSEEFYYGFESEKQKDYEKYLVENYGDKMKKKIAESKRRMSQWTKEDVNTVKSSETLFQNFADMLRNKVKPTDPKVQELVQEWNKILAKFGDYNKESFMGLGQLYCEHEGFRKFYAKYHADLPEYLKEAMEYFANQNLKD